MNCVTNMYGLNSGDWTLYLRLLGVVEQAVVMFSKHSHMVSNNLHYLIMVYGPYASSPSTHSFYCWHFHAHSMGTIEEISDMQLLLHPAH